MLNVPSFAMNMRPVMPLIHCIIDDTLSQPMPDLRQILLQFIDSMNLISTENVSMQPSVLKQDI